MRKILILLLFSTTVFAQQVSVQNNELKYRTVTGIATAANKDSVAAQISAAQISAASFDTTSLSNRIDFKVDKITGKGLSTNDYSNAAVSTLSTNTTNIGLLQIDQNALFDSVANKVNKITGKGLSTNDYSNAAVTTLSTNTTNITLLQADRNALFDSVANKVNKVSGKGLSTNDYTTTEKTKLTGIATGATANATDAALRDRTTHTGTQAISSIVGLQTAIDGKENALGNPTTNGFVLSSTTGGTRSWIAPPSGGGVSASANNAFTGVNTFAGNTILGGSVDSGEKLQVNGTSKFTADINAATISIPANGSSFPLLNLRSGDSNGTGFNAPANGEIRTVLSGGQRWRVSLTSLGSMSDGGALLRTGASSTVPFVFPTNFSTTGMGVDGAGNLSLIALGVETAKIQTNKSIFNSQLEIATTNGGFLPPRMTELQKNAIATPAEGLMIYQTTAPKGWYGYNGTVWVILN